MYCNKHKAEFKSFINSKKLKATPARLELLEVFAHEDKPISIQQLKRKIFAKTDLVTLYRNVEIFTKLGLLSRIQFKDKMYYYEFAKKNHHHHLVCTGCGKVSDVIGCKIKPMQAAQVKATGFANITSHSLEFFGICKKCA